MSQSPFADMKSPSIELWQNIHGSWCWVVVDRPDVNEPGIVVWDSERHPSPEAALEACDQVIGREGWRSGYEGPRYAAGR